MKSIIFLKGCISKIDGCLKLKGFFYRKFRYLTSHLSKKHISVSIATANFFFTFFFCKRKFLPLCKAISNSEKILLENTLNACALIYDGELSFWVCKVSRNQISQYVHELFLELHI